MNVETAIAEAAVAVRTDHKFTLARVALDSAQGISGKLTLDPNLPPDYRLLFERLLVSLQGWSARDRLRFVEGLAQQLQSEAPNLSAPLAKAAPAL